MSDIRLNIDVPRDQILSALVRCDLPLESLRASLAAHEFDWNGPPLAIVTAQSVVSVLHRYTAGELTGDDVEEWANLLETREDVEFGPNAEQAIFDLANPVLQGPLTEVAAALLARL